MMSGDNSCWRSNSTSPLPEINSNQQGSKNHVSKMKQRFEGKTQNAQPKKTPSKEKARPLLKNTCTALREDIKNWKKDMKKNFPKGKVGLPKDEDLQNTLNMLERLDDISSKYKDSLKKQFSYPTNERTEDNTCNPEDIRRLTEANTSFHEKIRSLTEANTSFQEKIQRLTEANTSFQEQIKRLTNEHTRYRKQIENEQIQARADHASLEENYKQSLGKLQNDLKKKNLEILELQRTAQKVRIEKDEALTRLSKMAGTRLTTDNANIADLSTELRPTKIAEKFRECYDNEWTDAYEELTDDGKTEEQTVEFLWRIIPETYSFSQEQSLQYARTVIKEISNFPMLDETSTKDVRENVLMTNDIRSTINDLRKATATSAVNGLQKKFVSDWKVQNVSLGKRTQLFIEKCVEITWYMVIQTPPVVIDDGIHKGDKMNNDLFIFYTVNGEFVDFPVWPCIRLHKDGPVLSKGVVQGVKEIKSPSNEIKDRQVSSALDDQAAMKIEDVESENDKQRGNLASDAKMIDESNPKNHLSMQKFQNPTESCKDDRSINDRGTDTHKSINDRGTDTHKSINDRGTDTHNSINDRGTDTHNSIDDRGTDTHESIDDEHQKQDDHIVTPRLVNQWVSEDNTTKDQGVLKRNKLKVKNAVHNFEKKEDRGNNNKSSNVKHTSVITVTGKPSSEAESTKF